MHQKYSHGFEFEQLVAELFRKLGHTDVRTNVHFKKTSSSSVEVDIVFEGPTGRQVVEVKHYRYLSPPPVELFIRALKQASRIKFEAEAKSSVLAISCPLTPALENAASAFPDVEVWDANALFRCAAEFPGLLKKLEQLFEVSAPAYAEPAIALEMALCDEPDVTPKKGRMIADSLKAIQPGRLGATDFEDACINALKYLFESDLHGWHEQLNTEDDLHRRDLICRILPKAEVWKLMLTDIRSRYVIFEFKNYTAPITQKEVVTTERYLYPSALRNVAILISPKGCASSATKVIQGAMRENGKLIMSLSVLEVESLLIAKDDGADPNTYLFDRVDEFLMRLGR